VLPVLPVELRKASRVEAPMSLIRDEDPPFYPLLAAVVIAVWFVLVFCRS
jgi:hypothetical protein